MRKKVNREELLGPEGSELRKFWLQSGCVEEGPDGIDEETAGKLNKLIERARRGELKGGIPEEVLEREKEIKFL